MGTANPERLSAADRIEVLRVVKDAEAAPLTVRVRREYFFNASAELLGADHWKWVHSFLMPGKTAPRNIDFSHGGRHPISFRQGIGHAIRAFELDGVPPENIVLSSLTRERAPFVRTIRELVGEKQFRDDPGLRHMCRDQGLGDFMYGIVPIAGTGPAVEFTGSVMGRKLGEPEFSQRDKEMFLMLLESSRHIHASGLRHGLVATVSALPKRWLVVLAGIASGQRNRDIAEAINRDESTVKKYAKRVVSALGYRHRKRLRESMEWPSGRE